jgi:putative transposase
MHSFSKIWIHAIWSTKDRRPLITPKIEPLLHEFMKMQFDTMGCPAKIINGTADHIHCLFNLGREKSVADVIKQIKGSSSHFLNSTNACDTKFAWQSGYGAFSVSEPGTQMVATYIKKQKEHHTNKLFMDEYNDFLRLHGFPPVDFGADDN